MLDVAIVGGGARGCLAALALQQFRPELSFCLFEKTLQLGGGPIDPIDTSKLDDRSRDFIAQYLVKTWNKALAAYPGRTSRIIVSAGMTVPVQLHAALLSTATDTITLSTEVTELRPDGVVTPGGFVAAKIVFDCRPRPAFKGPRITVASAEYDTDDHGLTCPILFDAGRLAGEKGVAWQYFPITSRRLLVRVVSWADGQHRTELPDLGPGHVRSFVTVHPFGMRSRNAFAPLLPSALEFAIRQALAIVATPRLDGRAMQQAWANRAAIKGRQASGGEGCGVLLADYAHDRADVADSRIGSNADRIRRPTPQ